MTGRGGNGARRHIDAAEVSHVRFSPSSHDDVRDGLVGFIRFRIAERLEVGCVALRVTRAGSLTFSWPERADSRGRTRTVVRPTTEKARTAIEGALLERLHPFLSTIRERVTACQVAVHPASDDAGDSPNPCGLSVAEAQPPPKLAGASHPDTDSRGATP
jgi:hypothetical protein